METTSCMWKPSEWAENESILSVRLISTPSIIRTSSLPLYQHLALGVRDSTNSSSKFLHRRHRKSQRSRENEMLPVSTLPERRRSSFYPRDLLPAPLQLSLSLLPFLLPPLYRVHVVGAKQAHERCKATKGENAAQWERRSECGARHTRQHVLQR